MYIFISSIDCGYIHKNGVHYIVPLAPLICSYSDGGGAGEDEEAFGYLDFFRDGSEWRSIGRERRHALRRIPLGRSRE
jgi:hypothetical protein